MSKDNLSFDEVSAEWSEDVLPPCNRGCSHGYRAGLSGAMPSHPDLSAPVRTGCCTDGTPLSSVADGAAAVASSSVGNSWANGVPQRGQTHDSVRTPCGQSTSKRNLHFGHFISISLKTYYCFAGDAPHIAFSCYTSFFYRNDAAWRLVCVANHLAGRLHKLGYTSHGRSHSLIISEYMPVIPSFTVSTYRLFPVCSTVDISAKQPSGVGAAR